MKFKIKNNDFINTLVCVLVFSFYKSFPKNVQVYMPLFLGIYILINTIILIYHKKYWEEILRNALLFISSIMIFIGYYNSAYKFNYSFFEIAALIAAWSFSLVAYTCIVSWKRTGNTEKCRISFLALACCLIQAIFITVLCIVK